MHAGADDFLDEQTKGLAELAEHLRTSRLATARNAAIQSAARIRSLNGRIRVLARSGVKLTSVSHEAAQDLIELQGEIINSALTDAAAQIERIANTGSFRDLARDQADVLKATRGRIADDLSRVMTILRQAAGEARKVAEREATPPSKKKGAIRKTTKPAARKVKRVARKATKPAARNAKQVPRKARGRTRKPTRRA
jgi:phasin family protein